MSAVASRYHRYSTWAETVPFSLNVIDGIWVEGPFVRSETVSVTPMISEFATSGASPSGSRHLQDHASFLRVLASGNGDATVSFDALDYNSIEVGLGSGISATKCIVFRINDFELETTQITDMKIWSPDLADFLYPQYSKLLYETHNTWTQDKSLGVASLIDTTKWVPSSLPSEQNLFRASGTGYTIWDTKDEHVSQYVYLAVAASGNTPLGEYGDTGNRTEGFRLRVTYSFNNILPIRD